MSKVVIINDEENDFLCKLIETKNDELLSGSEIELKKSIYERLSQKPKTLEDYGYTKEKLLKDTIFKKDNHDIYIQGNLDNIAIGVKAEYKDIEWNTAIHFKKDELIAIINKAYELFGGENEK